MFTPPPNFQNFSNLDIDDPSPSSAMAKRSAADASESVSVKEIPVRLIDEIDMEKFSVKQRGKKDEVPFFYASYDHSQLVINLTPKKWLRIPFAIENAYAQVDGKTQSLPVSVEVDADIANVIQELEAVVKAQVMAAVPGVNWNDSVRISGQYEPVFKAKLMLKADHERQLSMCTVRPFGKSPVKGVVGEEALKPLLKAHRGFRDAKVKLAVALHNIWFMKDKNDKQMAGVTWRVTNMMADLPELTVHSYQDIFADEAFPDE